MAKSPTPSGISLWAKRAVGFLVLVAVIFGLDRLANATLIDLAYKTIERIAIFSILAASLNLVNGVTGQFSLGHAAFMVIGAYTGGELSRLAAPLIGGASGLEAGSLQAVVFVAGMLAGAFTASIAGLLVGLPTLRLRGDYLAIATLGFGEITRVVIQGRDELGGATGLTGVPTYTTLFWALLVAVICITLLRNLQWSGPGRDFMAVREDEIAAAAVGVDIVRTKVTAFVTAAAFAGVAGVVLVHMEGVVDPSEAGFLHSIEIVVMVVLGGMGSLTGSILGAAMLVSYHAIFKGLPALNAYSQYENAIYPVLILGAMLARREGLMGSRELSWNSFARLPRLLRRRARR